MHACWLYRHNNHDKFMIRIILLALLSVLLSGCNLIFKNSKGLAPEPQVYFPDGQELKMAMAIYDGDTRSVQSMINDDVDLNRIGKGGMTYLFYAMLTINYDMLELLLKNGANPNIRSVFYTRPDLHKKGLSDDKTIGICLVYSGYGDYDIKYMKLLLKHGANINDTTYISPLVTAARDKIQGKEKIKYLAEQGINLNYTLTGTSVTAEQALIFKWNMVLFLLDLGADPLVGDDPKFTVAASVQKYYDRGFDLNSEHGKMAQEVKRRLEQRGVKFPYYPKKDKAASDSTEQVGETKR